MSRSLKGIIQKQQIEFRELSSKKTVTRELMSRLQESKNSALIKVVAGPRRAGKSTLILQTLKDTDFGYINFEDDDLMAIAPTGDEIFSCAKDLYGEAKFWFFDEIQVFPNWEAFLNKLHRRNMNLFVTGSNSQLLSKELSSSLTGRYQQFELFPFSFREFCLAKTGVSLLSPQDFLLDYLKRGGFPEVVTKDYDPKIYLRDLFSAIILKDIARRYKIRNIAGLNDLYALLVNSNAGRFSARSLERALEGRLSIATIQKYLRFAREAYLFEDLQRFHNKPRERLKADRKIYMIDNGFICACAQPLLSDPGHLLENLVFLELRRRGYVPGLSLFYYQTADGCEVDFLLREGAANKALLQVCRTLESPKTRDREIRGLFKAANELKAKELVIVTLQECDELIINGKEIQILPVIDWLQ